MIHSLGINGEGELRGQPANPGSRGKMAVKTVYMKLSVCNIYFRYELTISLCLSVRWCLLVGWRIGKGFGFSDLEYAMLASVGAITPEVPVVTVVHDCQVLDLPESLFDVHDVAVDYIVTPTRVIQCSGAKPRPPGIIWSLVSAERLDRVRILKRLRYREWKAGKDVRLAGETEDPTELTDEVPPPDDDDDRRGPPRRRNNLRRRPMKPRLDGDVDHVSDLQYNS